MTAPSTYDTTVVGTDAAGCAVTFANTNAPSMMIGHRAASFIAD